MARPMRSIRDPRVYARADRSRLSERWLALAAGTTLTTSALAQGGSWQGPWNWQNQFTYSSCSYGNHDELAHAALIPTGPHAGKILLWRLQVATNSSPPPPCIILGTSESWLFDPSNPTCLVKIDVNPPMPSDIFWAGGSWRSSGELLVVGGIALNSNPNWPKETYRFIPANLSRIQSGTPCPYIPVSATSPVWVKIGDTRIPHYYGSLLCLNQRPVNYSSALGYSPLPGGSTLLAGGPDGAYIDGNEFWEPIARDGTVWASPLLNLVYTPALPYPSPHIGFSGLPRDIYALHPPPPMQPAEQRLDAYPRFFQLSSDEILVTGDVDNPSPSSPWYYGCFHPGIDPNGAWASPGTWWVMKLRYLTAPIQEWQLWKGNNSPAPLDSFYDSVVLLHTLAPGGVGVDRAIRLGGSSPPGNQHGNPVGAWSVNSTVFEFVKGSPSANGGAVVDGQWLPKLTHPDFRRVFANAVILPTGELLHVGGSSTDSYGGHGGGSYLHPLPPGNPCDATPTNPQSSTLCQTPALQPALYRPGPANGSPPPHSLMAASTIPRLYHSVALLLLDGTVFIAGGESIRADPACGTSFDSFPKYSGEVFCPPYCQLSFRPSIVTVPRAIPFSTPIDIEVLRQASPNHIDRIVLLRPGSVTHHFDNDQRYIELSFTVVQSVPDAATGQVKDRLSITGPADTLAPPGWYMLFAVEQDGSGNRSPSMGTFILMN